MRDMLAASISAVISNMGLIASTEPNVEKRKVLLHEMTEGIIEGIQDCKARVNGIFYDGERAQLDSTILILRKAYSIDKPKDTQQ